MNEFIGLMTLFAKYKYMCNIKYDFMFSFPLSILFLIFCHSLEKTCFYEHKSEKFK